MTNADRRTNGKTGHIRDASLYGSPDGPGEPLEERLTVAEAASRLGVTPDAIRKRIKRGTIRHDAGDPPDGKTHVYLDASPTVWRRVADVSGDGSREKSSDLSGDTSLDNVLEAKDETIAELRDHNNFLRRELERKDAILLRMAERIPELEAPPEPRGAPETAAEPQTGTKVSPETQAPLQRRSWLYRFFFGPE